MRSQPLQIAETHLRRRAIIYVRQSSPEQVRDNVGSTAVQRDLVQRVESWGWPPAAIEVIDEDLGVSGSIPGIRQGFKRLLDLMQAGQVGLVAVTDSSRLTRNILDLARFADAAQRTHVLLAQGDQIIDFTDPNSAFIGGLLGLNAVRENRARVDLSLRARVKKAEAGIAPTGPPVGYIRVPGGAWPKDPDPHVRAVIELIFDKYLELGSANRVLRYLRTNSILVPRKPRLGKPGRWAEAKYWMILGFLKKPVYAGMYVYRRTVTEPDALGPRKNPRQLVRPESDWIRIPNHHEAYISTAQWADIQRRLAANRRTMKIPAGRGQALFQGLLCCALHKKALHTVYPLRSRSPQGDPVRLPRYTCRPFDTSSREHGGIRASVFDAVLEAEVLATLEPPSLEVIQDAARAALREHDALRRCREDELRRAEQAVAEAERAHDQADVAHVRLKQRLAERLEQALRQLENVRAHHACNPLVPPLRLDPTELDELRALLTDLPRLWRHPAVSVEERKALVRVVVKSVDVLPDTTRWVATVHWAGGAQSIIEVARPARPPATSRPKQPRAVKRLDRAACRVAWQAAAPLARAHAELGMKRDRIAEELNALGVPHPSGQWTGRRVIALTVRVNRGQVPGTSPLPPRDHLGARVAELHRQGFTLPEIVAYLQAVGVRTRHRTTIDVNTVSAALRKQGLRTKVVVRGEQVKQLLREHGPRERPIDLAARLNACGLTTRAGRPWTDANVREKLRDLGVPFVRVRRRSGLPPSPGQRQTPGQAALPFGRDPNAGESEFLDDPA